jgi:peroxiredoxin
MPNKKKKRSWIRARQIKQQRAQDAYLVQRKREAERKPRKWPKGKILGTICLFTIIFVAYGAWQYQNSQLPPKIGDETNNNPPSTDPAPTFSLKDINGTQFSLNQHVGKVIAVHFMALGCHGQYYEINDHQLKQLKTVCNSYCGSKPVTMVTVAVSTCPTTDLALIRENYGITWFLGNDYDDGTLDIVDAYVKYSIYDGTIVLIDKEFNVVQVYTDETAAETLSSKIYQLLGI